LKTKILPQKIRDVAALKDSSPLLRYFAIIDRLLPDFQNSKITMVDIAQELGITRERVRQLLLEFYGAKGRTPERKQKSAELISIRKSGTSKEKESKQIKTYGATEVFLLEKFGEDWRTPYGSYRNAKRTAIHLKKSIWKINYLEWLTLWADYLISSGHKSGRICVIRIDKSKPYKKDNLRVLSFTDFIKEVHYNKKVLNLNKPQKQKKQKKQKNTKPNATPDTI
jgi:hypothetical protein